MSLFFTNMCKFNKCELQFASLYDLIHHIEAEHMQGWRIVCFIHCISCQFPLTHFTPMGEFESVLLCNPNN